MFLIYFYFLIFLVEVTNSYFRFKFKNKKKIKIMEKILGIAIRLKMSKLTYFDSLSIVRLPLLCFTSRVLEELVFELIILISNVKGNARFINQDKLHIFFNLI